MGLYNFDLPPSAILHNLFGTGCGNKAFVPLQGTFPMFMGMWPFSVVQERRLTAFHFPVHPISISYIRIPKIQLTDHYYHKIVQCYGCTILPCGIKQCGNIVVMWYYLWYHYLAQCTFQDGGDCFRINIGILSIFFCTTTRHHNKKFQPCKTCEICSISQRLCLYKTHKILSFSLPN